MSAALNLYDTVHSVEPDLDVSLEGWANCAVCFRDYELVFTC